MKANQDDLILQDIIQVLDLLLFHHHLPLTAIENDATARNEESAKREDIIKDEEKDLRAKDV